MGRWREGVEFETLVWVVGKRGGEVHYSWNQKSEGETAKNEQGRNERAYREVARGEQVDD